MPNRFQWACLERLRSVRTFLPLSRLTRSPRWMTRPLRSFEFPRSRRYYGSLRPCASLRYSHPWRASPWTSPLSSRRQVPTFRTRAWSTFTPPLCRAPPTQATGSPWTPPGPTTLPGSDTVPTLSTRCRWFIRFVSSGPHLMRSRRTFSVTLTTSALDRRSSRWFGARPCRPAPGGLPPSLVQQALSLDHLWPPRAVVAHTRPRSCPIRSFREFSSHTNGVSVYGGECLSSEALAKLRVFDRL